jgi:spermidine synthase
MNRNNKKALYFVLFYLIGFNALIAQIIYIREFLVIFSGNEISLGIILGNWLFWTALGSMLAGRIQAIERGLKIEILLITILIPLNILIIRLSKLIIQPTPGEIPGILAIFGSTFLILAPVCFALGSLFVSCSRFFCMRFNITITRALSRVYLWESVGSAIGGALLSFLLFRFLSAVYITAILSLVNFAALYYLQCNRLNNTVRFLEAIGFIIFILSIVFLNQVVNRCVWQGMTFISERDSRYGKLSLVELADERFLYENGTILFSSDQEEIGEENVHYALLLHPKPEKVLMIGGGLSGGLMEAMKHKSLQHIDYVELDPAVISMYQQYFPEQWRPIASESNIQIHMLDGRAFLKKCHDTYDLIIVHMPDPSTMQLNRFYTGEFYNEIAGHLKPYGIYSYRVTGAENYISGSLANYLKSLYQTLKSQFRYVGIMPGNSIHYFASPENPAVMPVADTLIARINRREIQSKYVQDYFIRYRLMPDRIASLWQEIRKGKQGEINSDFRPVAYYYTLILWGMQFFPDMGKITTIFSEDIYWYSFGLILFLGILVLLILAHITSSENFNKGVACFAVMGIGFSVMTFEIFLLLVYQSLFGYLYHQVAILMAAVMSGLAIGSWLVLKFGVERYYYKLISLHVIFIILPMLFFYIMVYRAASSFHTLFFLMVMLSIGILGGAQFPLVNHLFCRTGRNPGFIYGFDLIGALLGALLVSTLCIPLFGLFKTALLIVVFNVLVILALLALRFKLKTPA